MGRSIRPRPTGVGTHAAYLVRSLAAARPELSFTVFLTQDAPQIGSTNIREVRAPFPTPNEYLRALWEQTCVPFQARSCHIELYHSPNYMLPVALNIPAIVTIHDLTYLDASLHRWTSHHYLRTMVRLAVHQARVIIAVSEYTKNKIERQYPESGGRVHVIYQGVRSEFRPQLAVDISRFRSTKLLDYPYVLFVGTIEPRKNVERLLHAFEMAVREAQLPHHLLLAGGWGWKSDGVKRALHGSRVGERIHQLGYVSPEDLPLYYGAADVVIYPSLEEGFGLPVAEAMACGAPVITSNASALPELVGDAALTVDPLDETALSEALQKILTDAELRRALAAHGPARAARFSWSECAERHLQLYRTVLGSCS